MGWYPSLTLITRRQDYIPLPRLIHGSVLCKVNPNCPKPAVISALRLPLFEVSTSLSVSFALMGSSGTAVADIPEIVFNYLS